MLLEIFPENHINVNDMPNRDSLNFKNKQKYLDYKEANIKKLGDGSSVERLLKEEEIGERIQNEKMILMKLSPKEKKIFVVDLGLKE